jgi:hypothetical protein
MAVHSSGPQVSAADAVRLTDAIPLAGILWLISHTGELNDKS